MPSEINPQCYHLSASSIAAFKACPTRFRLGYREGVRPDRDTDSQRVGTNWHAMHEVYANTLAEAKATNPDGAVPCDDALIAVVTLLDQAYADVPPWKDAREWAIEKQVLFQSFIGYLWYWQNDPIEFLTSELPFNLPLHMPRSGMPLPLAEVQRVGKVDHVIRWREAVGPLERKSTSRAIGPDSDYWERSQKDTQVSMYALAFRDMIASGHELPFVWYENERVGNTLYDVWHKPTIKPTMLTQRDTAALLEDCVYCNQPFTVLHTEFNGAQIVTVDNETAVVEQGKKGFAIKETVAMFGARLLADIYERPDFYFVRREIARTDAEVRQFRGELFAIYQAQKAYSKGNFWFHNEAACRATYPCQFIPICYGPGADHVCSTGVTPPGFKRIFVDLTVNGQEPEE